MAETLQAHTHWPDAYGRCVVCQRARTHHWHRPDDPKATVAQVAARKPYLAALQLVIDHGAECGCRGCADVYERLAARRPSLDTLFAAFLYMAGPITVSAFAAARVPRDVEVVREDRGGDVHFYARVPTSDSVPPGTP